MNNIIQWILQTEFGRRIEIQLLMNLVTDSLQQPRKHLLRMPSDRSLNAFAAYTAKQLGQCTPEQQQRLHTHAFRLGSRLRRCLTCCNHEALTQLTFLLYRNIGIKMEGHFPGNVVIGQCHFCHYYSPHICTIASLMDSGVISGLFGGARLEFNERITEGDPHCLCTLAFHTKNETSTNQNLES